MSTDNEWLRLIHNQLILNAGGGGGAGATEATLVLLGRENTLQFISSVNYGIRADLSIALQRGQKVMDSSLPVTIAVNQSPIPVVIDVQPRVLDITSSEYTPGSGASDLGGWTVPANKQWEFLCMVATYTTPATGSNRQMLALIGDDISVQFASPLIHPPSQTIQYAVAPGLVEYSAIRRDSLTICTSPMVVGAGGSFKMFMQNAQVADAVLGYALYVKER